MKIEIIVSFLIICASIFMVLAAIGRAAYFAGVPLWSGTTKDELKEYYSPEETRKINQ